MSRLLLLAISIFFFGPIGRAQNITLVGTNKPINGVGFGDVWGEGNIACLGVWTGYGLNYGVGILDISTPSSPVLTTIYTAPISSHNRFEHGAVRDKIGYFASWAGSGTTNSGGVHIVSLTNAAAPVLLSKIGSISGTTINGFDDVHTMFLERNYLYEAAHIAGIVSVKVFDVSDPFLPVYLWNIVTTNTTKVHQITVRNKGTNTILYTSGWGGNDNGNTNSFGQTDIWDVSSIGTQPALWLGRVYSGYNSHSSWPTPDGNTLVVCREMSGGDVRFYDISNPTNPSPHFSANPTPIVTISPASMGLENDIPHNPVVISNLLFLSWYQNGLQIFDISDRTKPVRVGSYDTFPGNRSASFQGNWGIFPNLGLDRILVSDIQSGFFILNATNVLTATTNYPPLLVSQPASLTATQGLTAVFSPTITGSSLKYQWRFNGTNLPGATNSTLTLANVQTNNAGNYQVIASNLITMFATNQLCAVTSAVATLSVIVSTSAPTIASQPQSISVYPQEPATFQVGVIGSGPLFYQWRFNGSNLTGATNSSFTRPNVQPEEAGAYSVVVSNSFGTVTSSNALLTITDSPYISNVQAAPGSRSALISWNTAVPSDSQVQFDDASTQSLASMSLAGAQASFSQSSYIDQTLLTNHTILLTGLTPGTRYNFQVISAADTNHYLSGVYQFTTAGTVILDNTNSQVTFTGSWTLTSLSTNEYGPDYRFANTTTGPPTATATYTPDIPATGKYDIHIWYPEGSNRASNAPFFISYSGGTTNILVNQKTNGGFWRLLATNIPLARGVSGFVRLSNNASNNVVIADAVRFTYIEDQDFPTNGTVPRWWESFYFGGTTNPALDPDGDGYSTAEEYLMGTSPIAANSSLEIAIQAAGNAANITFWPYLGNRQYRLLSNGDLAAPNWLPIPESAVTSSPYGHGTFTVIVTNAAQAFYQLSVQLATNDTFTGSIAAAKTRAFSPFASEPICGVPNRLYVK